jgi:hypothetical protein
MFQLLLLWIIIPRFLVASRTTGRRAVCPSALSSPDVCDVLVRARREGSRLTHLGIPSSPSAVSSASADITASLGSFTASLGGFTASLGGFTASLGGFTASLGGFTASLGGFTASLGASAFRLALLCWHSTQTKARRSSATL